MSYVDCHYDREHDRILVVERKNGQRIFKEYPAEYWFYYDDPAGRYKTIFGNPVSKVHTNSQKEFRKELGLVRGKTTYESDFNPIFRCLENNYKNAVAPKLNVAFLDIETDFCKERGFAPPAEPFNKITAISVYLGWLGQMVTLAMPPRTKTIAECEALIADIPGCYMFEDEGEMLNTLLDVIADADIISGWNSEGFDIPYTVNRTTMVLSKNDTRRFCLWNLYPKGRTFERYGAEHQTYDLLGRVHMDYMQLYRKYTYEERHSYSLDAIGEYELNEKKIPYDGSLDQLYNGDFRKFIEYNRQDTALLAKLDKKLRFIELANQLAHDNTVLLQTTMGAVAVTEQAIVNEAHEHGLVVPDRVQRESVGDLQAAGAYVAHPKKGLHDWIGSIDINSLYPSVIRALNMAPETILGQIRQTHTDEYIRGQMADISINGNKKKKGATFAEAWEGLFASLEYSMVMARDNSERLTVDWESGESTEMTGAQIYQLIFESESGMVLSANGTIFSLEKAGIIPGLLERWYSERKALQAIHKKWLNLSTGIDLEPFGLAWPGETAGEKSLTLNIDHLYAALNSKDQEAFNQFVLGYDLEIRNGKLWHKNAHYVDDQVEYWDKRQHVKKINLNSLYGAILNVGCRFWDKRIGQSTTLSGRSITKGMTEATNEFIEGDRNHLGRSIIYNDTDSVYFSAWPAVQDEVASGALRWDRDVAIQMYDAVADYVNECFPGIMKSLFNCPADKGSIIKAGREIVAARGLFITKKRYALLYYDKDGKRVDKDGVGGKVKAMGLDLKRADTPKQVQEFLLELLTDVLYGGGRDSIIEKVLAFKRVFKAKKPWEKGTPKRVNNLTSYSTKEYLRGKSNMPGHVRAAMNWNALRGLNHDRQTMGITDGQKAIVCKLRPNPLGWTSIAYPTDEVRLPTWFLELPFDEADMEQTIVDQKVSNLLGVLEWGIEDATDTATTFGSLFDFT